MESAIPIIGAYERGHGLEISELPEMIHPGRAGMVRLFKDGDLKDSRSMSNVSDPFYKKPVETLFGALKSLRPITLELVSGSELEPVWDYLVKQFHYLLSKAVRTSVKVSCSCWRASRSRPFLERCSP